MSSRAAAVPKAVSRLARLIHSKECRRISFLTGAGVSVAAGIPDFRSPGGMYETLRPELLTATPEQRAQMARDPTSVVSWNLFRDNQLPYLEVRRPFILGLAERQWQATLAHWFIALVHAHGKLHTLYTQNIDGLDFQTTVPCERIISVHGTMGRVECEFCGAEYPLEDFCSAVRAKVRDIYNTGNDDAKPKISQPIPCLNCGLPGVKPATVLYGRSLPRDFFDSVADDLPATDLLIVMGTSLTVHPAASLPQHVSHTCARAVINLESILLGDDSVEEDTEEAGGGGVREPDHLLIGDCDTVVAQLLVELGWAHELNDVRDAMAPGSAQTLQTAMSLAPSCY